MPAWLKVCCPNVSSLKVEGCRLTPQLLDLPPPPAAPAASCSLHTQGQPSPLTCQHLQRIDFSLNHDDEDDDDDEDGGGGGGGGGGGHMPQWRQHIRQQLAALPSLTSLDTDDTQWMLEPALVSTSVTSLGVPFCSSTQRVAHLAVQFPNLRQLDAAALTVDDDAGLEALFRLPHLERLSVYAFHLQRSHAHRAWAVRHLTVEDLDVAAHARLPLESVQTCTVEDGGWIRPASDAQAVARVAEAVGRWGGLGVSWDAALHVGGLDAPALLTALGPLLAALPAAQWRELNVGLGPQGASPSFLQALGQALPRSTQVLRLWDCAPQPEAWPALLPGLPASVTFLWLWCAERAPTEDQLVALCGAAVRPINVAMRPRTPPGDVVESVARRLAQQGKEQLVTLLGE